MPYLRLSEVTLAEKRRELQEASIQLAACRRLGIGVPEMEQHYCRLLDYAWSAQRRVEREDTLRLALYGSHHLEAL